MTDCPLNYHLPQVVLFTKIVVITGILMATMFLELHFAVYVFWTWVYNDEAIC